ncbi:MAG: hypothetical protein Q9227_008663 [Pyrenula ochraceoflavens]
MSRTATWLAPRANTKCMNHVPHCSRCSSSQIYRKPPQSRAASTQQHAPVSEGKTGASRIPLAHKAREKLANKEFYLNLLNSAATKRDAKAYLSRLKEKDKSTARQKTPQPTTQHERPSREAKPSVNLGGLYGHARAVDESPVFEQRPKSQQNIGTVDETIHIALVTLLPETCDDETLNGIGQTLAQLSKLSMVPCVVVNVQNADRQDPSAWRKLLNDQVERTAAALEEAGVASRRLDNVFSVSSTDNQLLVQSRKSLLRPLKQGCIPVVPPTAFDPRSSKVHLAFTQQAILALAKELAGLSFTSLPNESPESVRDHIKKLQKEISLDRLILIDDRGGIPRPENVRDIHVFINLEQEFQDVLGDLGASIDDPVLRKSIGLPPTEPDFIRKSQMSSEVALHHFNNALLLQKTLALLPPSSSALITTPEEAARSSRESEHAMQVSGVGTRRQKNPLIHNLLTDKPAHSSSLPIGRLGTNSTSRNPPVTATSTFVKRGMPLTILPDPRIKPWVADNHGQPRLTLNDPAINIPRLVHLIEDSFDRKLNVEHYLKRINNRIAGLIIAGEYEGGALLTWETPPGVPDDGSAESVSRLVPYLDKFAVLKRSQGAGGVADIVFNAMVRGCFPKGVCWRSRRNNPVNKWYFERARGTWKLPGTEWTMFWTTEGVEDGLFEDYSGVCRNVLPSWADKKHIVD